MDSFSESVVEPEGNKKLKCANSFTTKDVDDIIPETPSNRLCKDDLSLIFSNCIISTKDLLSFRQVNKSWRDAATTSLLQRDTCRVSLKMNVLIKEIEYNDDGEACDRVKLYFCKRGDREPNLNELNTLTELISNSTKFPASNFHIITSCVNYYVTCYSKYSDLLLFFKIHGDKIKTLAPEGCVSQQLLRDIFCIYTPNLECLDLTNARLLPLCEELKQEQKSSSTPYWTSKVLPFKSLIIPCRPHEDDDGDSDDFFPDEDDEYVTTYREILHLLLSSPSNLICIKNVDINSVANILQEEKGHLIKTFELTELNAVTPSEKSVKLLQKLAAANPKLSKLTLEAPRISGFCSRDLTSINKLLESSKDTLKELDLTICPADYHTKFKIFPMKNLKSISLRGPRGSNPFKGYCSRRAFSAFEAGLSPRKYFPALVKLRLVNSTVEQNCKSLFQFKCNKDGSLSGGGIPQLEVLEIIDSKLPMNSDSGLMTSFFPNIRMLKIEFHDLRVASSLWTMFPLLEFMEIKTFFSLRYDFVGKISCVDELFTGFSLEQCQKLLKTKLPQFLDNPEELKSLRVQPSICGLKHLKELKLHFPYKLKTEYLSHVTGAYAFLQMPNTKFIITYSGTFNNLDEAERYFASIKPYAQILPVCELLED